VSQGFPGINPGLPHGYDIDVDAPVYAISIAAQLAGLHPQTLRQYDRLGLVSPDRTGGRNRLYSLRDVARLREVTQLSNDGVNLAGITQILHLQAQVDSLSEELEAVRARVRELLREKQSTALVVWQPQRRRPTR
jgi:MerR family transcriptional regulator/heat shock protein HspR